MIRGVVERCEEMLAEPERIETGHLGLDRQGDDLGRRQVVGGQPDLHRPILARR